MSLASSSNFPSVGLYFSTLVLRFLSPGFTRVGGGIPIALRDAALTADAARNGFGLRFFAATMFCSSHSCGKEFHIMDLRTCQERPGCRCSRPGGACY